MKNYIRPDIDLICANTADVITTSPVDLTDKVESVYSSWKGILNGLSGTSSTSFGGYGDNGGFN